jgi:cell division cycle protein 37
LTVQRLQIRSSALTFSAGSFRRMQQGGPKAESVFQTDVNDTYNRMSTRCAQIKIEQAQSGGGERETIQLVAEDPSTKIGFNIPDGPAPENLVIEGLEEGQEVDIEEIKVFLNQKWEYFQGFPETLKRAMKSESLDEVNKVLERMNLEEAEEIVRKMQEGGMLSFRCVFVDDEEYFPFVAW